MHLRANIPYIFYHRDASLFQTGNCIDCRDNPRSVMGKSSEYEKEIFICDSGPDSLLSPFHPGSSEPAFAALLLELNETFIPRAFVRIFTLDRRPFSLHRVEPGRA